MMNVYETRKEANKALTEDMINYGYRGKVSELKEMCAYRVVELENGFFSFERKN